jgi:hypothetical protein
MWKSGCITPAFLTSALDGREWLAANLPPGKLPLMHTEQEVVWASRVRLDAVGYTEISYYPRKLNTDRPSPSPSLYRLDNPPAPLNCDAPTSN